MNKVIDVMGKKIKSLLNNNLARNVLIISSGTVLTQALGFIFSPIITRVYLPTEYGLMSMFTSLMAILSVVSSLNYEMALPIVKKEKKAKNLLILCIILLVMFVSLFSIISIPLGDTVLALLNVEALMPFRLLIIVGLFLYGLRLVLLQWFYRKKNFSFITKSQVAQNIVGNSSIVTFGLLGFGPMGLLLGQILKDTFSVIPFSLKILKTDNIMSDLSKEDITWNIKRFKNYPLYQTPSSFISILKNQLPIFSLAYYGSSIVGLYGLANTVVKIPMTLLGHSVRNVFFAEAASIGKENPKRIKLLSNSILKQLIVIGIVPVIVLLLFGPFLFSLVFGMEWEQAGEFSRFLSISVYADFICSPFSRIYEIFEKQQVRLLIDVFGLIIVFTAFMISRVVSPEPLIAIIFYTIAMSVYLLVIFIVARMIINREAKK